MRKGLYSYFFHNLKSKKMKPFSIAGQVAFELFLAL